MPETNHSTAVVYYSKSGHSCLAAENLSLALNADLYRLQTKRYHMPYLGYLRGGLDSLRQTKTPLAKPLPDLSRYDVSVICGPIWTSYPAAPLRSYVAQVAHFPPTVGLLLTCGDHSPPEKAYALFEKDIGRKLDATGAIPNALEATPEGERRLNDFLSTLQQAIRQKANNTPVRLV